VAVVAVDGTLAPMVRMELVLVVVPVVVLVLPKLVEHLARMVMMVETTTQVALHMVLVAVVVPVVLVEMDQIVLHTVLVMVERDFRHQQHLEIQHHYHHLDLVV
tara:strand:- start:311 stop:622 length:312 start_codon:yes stop_codon:yes gene_type:complete